MTTAVILGLLSAIFYGSTDFVARLAGRRVGPLRTILYGHFLAATLLSFSLSWTGFPAATPWAWGMAVLANLFGLAATGFLYHALTIGRLALVAPVAASYGAITALLSILSGDAFGIEVALGLPVIVVGGVFLARSADAGASAQAERTGLGPAMAAAACYGVGFWLQGTFAIPELGFAAATWSYYMLGASSAFLITVVAGQPLALPERRDLPLVASTTLLACAGSLCLGAGQAIGAVATVTVLSALASGVTVLLARFLLREDVTLGGYLGLALVIVGLIILNM